MAGARYERRLLAVACRPMLDSLSVYAGPGVPPPCCCVSTTVRPDSPRPPACSGVAPWVQVLALQRRVVWPIAMRPEDSVRGVARATACGACSRREHWVDVLPHDRF